MFFFFVTTNCFFFLLYSPFDYFLYQSPLNPPWFSIFFGGVLFGTSHPHTGAFFAHDSSVLDGPAVACREGFYFFLD